MADASQSGSPSWLDIFAGLPPLIQGAAIGVAAITFGLYLWQMFSKRLNGEAPKSTDFAIGGPTTFADMQPIRDLVAGVEALTKKMSELCDLVAQHLVDLREQREADEIDEARREGYESGLAARKPVRRRRPAKAPPKG